MPTGAAAGELIWGGSTESYSLYDVEPTTSKSLPCIPADDRVIFSDVKMTSKVSETDGCAVRSIDPDKVARTRERLIGEDEAEPLAVNLKLLGEPNRLRMLYALSEAGELCVCDLAAVVEVSETSVSHAMRLLRAAGIVRNRRDGRMIYYRLDDAHVRMLLDLSREHFAHGIGQSAGEV